MRASAVHVSVAELHAFCSGALRGVGVGDDYATIITDKLVLADSWGTFTHGTKLLGGYIAWIRAGGIRADAEPSIAGEGPAWAIVDGDAGPGQVVADFAMRKAIDLAREAGMAYVGVRSSCHFGAAGCYSVMAAEENMVGIAMANDIPSVAAPGSRRAVLGTNPISYAVPTGRHDPILLDMATSTVAGGKVFAAQQLGNPIPGNWIIDSEGRPTTDSRLFPHNAALAPMTGHKGYGIALMIESLSGILSGAQFGWGVRSWPLDDPTKPTGHGAAFLAFNVGAMMPMKQFLQRMDDLVDEIHSAPVADGADKVFVPGEMEWNRRREALANGIILPPDVVAKVQELAGELNQSPEWLKA